ncbi:MAG: YeeE/YedE family protein [Alphaproteobacteria bacterium]|jgi:uncharacterized membrane protein YedE/YeeE
MDTYFTPITSFQGGLAIGLGAVLLMLGLGRILGATGIISGIVFPENRSEQSWRVALVLGMILAPGLLYALTGTMPSLDVPVGPEMIVVGGILVGFGASLGSGCTSGHGVCGLSRLSIRSLMAVPVFMVTAAVTVFFIRHIVGV